MAVAGHSHLLTATHTIALKVYSGHRSGGSSFRS